MLSVPAVWKYVIFFKTEKQIISDVFLITKGFVFLIDFVYSRFDAKHEFKV